MPWATSDVDRFHKGLSDKQKRQWVAIANGVLSRGGSEKSAIMQANGTVGTREDAGSIADDIDAAMGSWREAFDERSVRRDREGQFTFSTGGTSKSGEPRNEEAALPTHLAKRYGVSPARMNTEQGREMLKELADALKGREANDGKWTDELRRRVITARTFLATGHKPSAENVRKSMESGKSVGNVVMWSDREMAEVAEAASDDHFYGPWSGGSKGAGGRPRTGPGPGGGYGSEVLGPARAPKPDPDLTSNDTLTRQKAEFRAAVAGQKDTWVAGAGGTEMPYRNRHGATVQRVYNPKSGLHGYLDVSSDVIYSDRELPSWMQ